MADRRTVVVGTDMVEACASADAALAPSRHTSTPAAAGLAEKISTSEAADASALPGSGRKSPGIREWWGNFWTGAASTAAKIMTEVLTVTTQVAGVPTAYNLAWKDAAGNVLFSIALNATQTTFTFFDSVASATTYFLPSATYEGTVGSWFVQMMNAVQGIYNRGWAAASGVPAHILRVFDDATADDVLQDIQDDGTSGSPKSQHKVYGDGATMTCANAASGGGLLERVVAGSWNDGAVHALYTSEVIAEKSAAVLEVLVVAEKSDGTARGRWKWLGTFYRETAGNISMQGSPDDTGTAPDNPPLWLCDFALDAGNQKVLLNVQTAVAENVTWKAVVRRVKVVIG